MNLKNLLTEQYLFEINAFSLDRSDKIFFIMGAAFVVVAAVLKLAAVMSPSSIDFKYRQKFFRFFLTIGLAEVIWYGARIQHVRFFGSHFVAWLILLVGLVWFVGIAIVLFKNYSKEKNAWDKEQLKLKYLSK